MVSFSSDPRNGNVNFHYRSSQGNAVPGLATNTIPQLNVATIPLTIAGYLVDLDNVTISSGTSILTPGETWGTSNLTLTITDSSNNSMTLFYWPTSYSAANVNLANVLIPTGPVDMTGFDSVFAGPPAAPEFSPITVTPIPEPVSASLLAVGGVALLMRRRRTA